MLEVNDKKLRGHQRSPSDNQEFRERTKKDAFNHLENELDRLQATAPEPLREAFGQEFRGFKNLFKRFLKEEGPSLEWDRIQKLPDNAIYDYCDLSEPSVAEIKELLNKLVVVKLNGGLGTSMGCHGPKSVITVRNNFTFLDLTVQQIENLNKTYGVNVPLILMNSFNTDHDTQRIIRKYKNLDVEIHVFKQSCYPRISKDSLLPLAQNCNVDQDLEAWYPPGHGDFYDSIKNTGLLDKFIQQGRDYCFISNIDNLGATVDLNILNFFIKKDKTDNVEFLMEVTDKTRADVKGGTLILYENKLRLLEIAQVPKDHVDEFKSIKKFKYFNTNNLWVKLTGIRVPRSRFLPVKKTSDLLLVMSNLYALNNGSLVMSPKRMFPTTPFIKLGDNHFSKVHQFLTRFATVPDILELDHLTVSGDVTFGKGVSLRGTVIIIANHGDRIDLPSGTILENKIVSGNLRILDH
ncbi:UTP--glucose-1-phosphate uridylyltransferase isoform X3 [Leptopilina boulardi]|uniref:UTP--glucose-1-phosphate uridylyltransferase isoform X3 n=1 Tax=Leptopilina boulardi TaxID=63433 RepID=UPI0021F512F7|nr:UTP--glucose-1-phosphate uridylyltransferase isoform X3 [Leptopilina boulardi]